MIQKESNDCAKQAHRPEEKGVYVRIVAEETHHGYLPVHQLRSAVFELALKKVYGDEPANITEDDRLVVDGKRTYLQRTVHSGEPFDVRIREATEKDREFLDIIAALKKLFD